MNDTIHDLESARENSQRIKLAASNPSPEIPVEPTGGGGDNGGMDLINYRLDQLEKRADKTDAKLDKLVDTVNAMNINLTSSTESLKGRLDLIEKKLPNWWQPYVGVGVISALLAGMVALAHAIFH